MEELRSVEKRSNLSDFCHLDFFIYVVSAPANRTVTIFDVR